MKVFRLVQLVFSKAEKGLWYDHDMRNYDEKGWGVALRVFAGPVVRPMTRPKYWFSRDWVPSRWNAFDPKYHMLIKFWVPFAPFLSVAFGRFGFYVGFKVFDLQSVKYIRLVGDGEVYHGSQALTPSISIRSTRWK